MDTTFISSFFFLLFLLTTFSSARIPFDDSTHHVIIDNTNPTDSSSSNNPILIDDDDSILLPSDKPEPKTLIRYRPQQTVDSKKEVSIATESSNNNHLPHHPFTVYRIEPSRIPRRSMPLSYRPVHRCHHNHPYKPWNNNRHFPRRCKHVITNIHVDDNVDNKDFDRVARGVGRRRRFGHINIINKEPMFFRERGMAMEKSELLRRLYRRRYHQRRQDQEPRENEIKDTTVGLVKRIRKFLNRF